jgi:hypothetical protein
VTSDGDRIYRCRGVAESDSGRGVFPTVFPTVSHPVGMLVGMDDVDLTPENLDAWNRSMAEIERRSQACNNAIRFERTPFSSSGVDPAGGGSGPGPRAPGR